MFATSPAKINIGLNITGKRDDGYHLLESFMLPIPLYDVIEIIENNEREDRLTSLGIVPDVEAKDNLVIKAVRLFRNEFLPSLPFLDLALYKKIPFGAGMGGGSSNAVTVLKMLREEYCPDISDDRLRNIAVRLGADCPFFVSALPQIARGIGEILHPVKDISLSGKYLLLIKPNINISTKEAFSGILISENGGKNLEDCVYLPMVDWQKNIFNSFETSLFPIYPVLREIKDWMLFNGAVYASLTGSGATMYGFSDLPMIDIARERYPDFFTWSCQL